MIPIKINEFKQLLEEISNQKILEFESIFSMQGAFCDPFNDWSNKKTCYNNR